MAGVGVLGSSIFLSVFLLTIPTTRSVSESQALFKLKESFTNPTTLALWKPGTEPCSAGQGHWIGVKCDGLVVTGLNLGHLGLSGKIDVDALASIPGLRSISFVSNAFSGPIPDFSPLVKLRGLNLSMNQFSGEIPPDHFSNMDALRTVWLSGNMFSGPIPSSLAQLPHLIELHLDNNRFSGTIPLLEQQSLVSLGLSYNDLRGEIPPGLSRFSIDTFAGNPGLCGGNVNRVCEKPPLQLDSLQAKIVVWVILASLIMLFALMFYGIYVLKRRQDCNLDMMNDFEPSISAPIDRKKMIELGQQGLGASILTRPSQGLGESIQARSSRKMSARFGKEDIVMMNDDKGVFGLADLMKATAEVLGDGALGSSYKATMVSGLTVVVKRVKVIAKMGKEPFDSEMRKLGDLKHRNVLAPLAYHYRKDERLLVYEYQPKGSLLFVLHGDRDVSHSQLNWPTRLKIIQGIARGLAHLHTRLPFADLPHGNLKSSNILLSQNCDPLLSDFGLNPLIAPGQAPKALTAYRSPEAVLQNQVSPKCDVYFLGVVILEILTGKFPIQYLNKTDEGGTDLVQWVRLAIAEGKGGHVFDPDIGYDKDCVGEMEKILRIGVDCTESDPGRRLDLTEAVQRIEGVSKDGDVLDTAVSFRTAASRYSFGDEPQDVFTSFRQGEGLVG